MPVKLRFLSDSFTLKAYQKNQRILKLSLLPLICISVFLIFDSFNNLKALSSKQTIQVEINSSEKIKKRQCRRSSHCIFYEERNKYEYELYFQWLNGGEYDQGVTSVSIQYYESVDKADKLTWPISPSGKPYPPLDYKLHERLFVTAIFLLLAFWVFFLLKKGKALAILSNNN